MCMFCAAIPTAMALGAAAHGKQREAERRAEADGQPAPHKPRVPVVTTTTAAVVMLVVASLFYHTHQPI